MTFPLAILPIKVELYLNSTWTDVTTYVYERDLIRITRGREDEASEFQSGRCLITFDNRDGRFSPRLPTGAYYGHIGRNTPIRVSALIGDTYLLTDGSTASTRGATTPDAAALDITGDIEVQYDGTLDNWHAEGSVELAGKGDQTGDQRSWLLLMRDRDVYWEWSADGTSTTFSATSTEPLPVPPNKRVAVKVTHDVNNGASGNTVTFYWAPTIAGPWTQLGAPVVGGSTTSIFSSSAEVACGQGWESLGFASPIGKTHAFKLINGIGGTEVANPDFTAQASGATSFADGTGKTWTVNSGSEITNRKIRFVGEVSEWPVEWDTGGDDVYVKVQAQGIKRRLTRGLGAIQSTLRRRIPTDADLVAYWPMEDGVNTNRPASPIEGVQPMITNRLAFQSDDTLPGSSALPTFTGTTADNTYIHGPIPDFSSADWRAEMCFKIDELPAARWTFMDIFMSESAEIAEWKVQLNDAGGRVLGLDSDGNTDIDEPWTWTGILPEGDWCRLAFEVQQNGLNYDWLVRVTQIDGGSQEITALDTGSVGRPLAVGGPSDGFHPDLTGMAVGHYAVFKNDISTIFGSAVDGYSGETARARLERLADEEGITINVFGEGSEAMGAQRPEELITLIQQCADADGGILGEERESVALSYFDRVSLYDQTPAMTLDYNGDDGLVTPVIATDDDRFTRNQIQVTIKDGTNQDAELLTGGPLAIDQVGRYFDSWNLVLADDDQGLQAAHWKLHLGTWDESRYPVVTVLLQAAPDKIDEATSVDVGSVIRITDPPAWLPPDDIDLMVHGYEEILHQYRWELSYNCGPAKPWTTVHTAAASASDDHDAVRADTAGCTLNEELTSGETAADVHNSGEYRWVDSATYSSDFPFDLNIGGEQVTCTALTPWFQDTFTRSVTDGWGSPTIGGAYTNTGGVAGNYDVTGSVGTHTLTTVNVSRRSSVTAAHADFDIVVDVASNDAPSGDSQYVGPMARHANGDNVYHARLEWTTANACILAIRKRVAAVESTVGTAVTTGHTFAVNTFFRIRFRGDGTRLRARVWLTTEDEPTHWHIDEEDSDLTAAGSIGVRSILGSANTDVNPVISYDNINLYSDQIMTLTRSVNGVVKAQSTGTDVRLWTPPIIAY